MRRQFLKRVLLYHSPGFNYWGLGIGDWEISQSPLPMHLVSRFKLVAIANSLNAHGIVNQRHVREGLGEIANLLVRVRILLNNGFIISPSIQD